jgi:NADH:ubiquinone oxidoreductase subunit D
VSLKIGQLWQSVPGGCTYQIVALNPEHPDCYERVTMRMAEMSESLRQELHACANPSQPGVEPESTAEELVAAAMSRLYTNEPLWFEVGGAVLVGRVPE